MQLNELGVEAGSVARLCLEVALVCAARRFKFKAVSALNRRSALNGQGRQFKTGLGCKPAGPLNLKGFRL